MTSPNGNIFRSTGHLWGGWWFETQSRPLWRHISNILTAVLSLVYLCGIKWCIYPCSTGLFHWYWGNRRIAPIQWNIWMIWVKLPVTLSISKHTERLYTFFGRALPTSAAFSQLLMHGIPNYILYIIYALQIMQHNLMLMNCFVFIFQDRYMFPFVFQYTIKLIYYSPESVCNIDIIKLDLMHDLARYRRSFWII